MEATLGINAFLAAIEAAAYAGAAMAIARKGGDSIRRYFVAWWALAAFGLLTSIALLVSGAIATPAVAFVKTNLALTFISASFGVASLGVFLWYLLRGTKRGWVFFPIAAAAATTAVAALAQADATVAIGTWGVRLVYAEGPPALLFGTQGVLSLLALGLGTALVISTRKLEGQVKTRTAYVSAAVILYYVSKAIAGAALTGGYAGAILILTRAMGLAAAYCGYRAYIRAKAA